MLILLVRLVYKHMIAESTICMVLTYVSCGLCECVCAFCAGTHIVLTQGPHFVSAKEQYEAATAWDDPPQNYMEFRNTKSKMHIVTYCTQPLPNTAGYHITSVLNCFCMCISLCVYRCACVHGCRPHNIYWMCGICSVYVIYHLNDAACTLLWLLWDIKTQNKICCFLACVDNIGQNDSKFKRCNKSANLICVVHPHSLIQPLWVFVVKVPPHREAGVCWNCTPFSARHQNCRCCLLQWHQNVTWCNIYTTSQKFGQTFFFQIVH